MSREHWLRVKAQFLEALELEGGARREFLDRIGGEDPESRLEIESLLASHSESEAFLEHPPAEIAAEALGEGTLFEAAPSPDLPPLEGRRLGPYKILRRIGHGGLGSVYLATREEEFRKEVAIKLIRRTVATSDLQRRFEFERQILASIEHPNIARLLDGGTTEAGLPYLVMEYIDGEPLDQFCDRNQLSVDERLEIFVTVCEAVEKAHHSLVVHCDLKPDNILVTQEGVPKLLDFGIARILGPEAATGDQSPEPKNSSRILTPDYASPEQLRGDLITTASDVYSLGVLLYELLAGVRPHRVADLSLDEAARVVSGSRPRRPSTVPDLVDGESPASLSVDRIDIEKTAADRSTTPSSLRRRLAGDLDSIVIKALQTDPLHRYTSVDQLATDIRSFLNGFPVLAREGGVAYRASRFVRRHRLTTAAVAVAVVTLLSFLGVLAVQSARLAAARDRAEREAAAAEIVSEFLQEMLTSADPYEGIGGNATVLEALDLAVTEIEGAFAGQPALEAAVRDTAGMTYLQLGRYNEAETQLTRGLKLWRQLGTEHEPGLARGLNGVGLLAQARGRYAEAEVYFREALQITRRVEPPDPDLTSETTSYLATVRHDRGDLAEAENLYREALASRRALAGDDTDIAMNLDDLGGLLQEQGTFDVAEEMFREALAIRRQHLPPGHPDISASLNNLASVLHDQEMMDEAEDLYRRSLRMARQRFDGDHPQVAIAINNLATLLHDKGELKDAEALYRESLSMTQRVQGDAHPEVATSLGNLASLLHDKGELTQAEHLYRQSLAMARTFLGEDHLFVARVLEDLAILLEDRGDLSAAETTMREALETTRRAADPENENVAFLLGELASLVCAQNEPDRAVPIFREALVLLANGVTDEDLVTEIRTALEACTDSPPSGRWQETTTPANRTP